MPSISSFILGLFVASVIADATTLNGEFSTNFNNKTFDGNHSIAGAPPVPNLTMNTTSNITAIFSATSSMNTTNTTTNTYGTMTPSTTDSNGHNSTKDDNVLTATTPTPKPDGTSQTTNPATTTKTNHKTTKPQPISEGDDKIGIVILIVIILVALGFGVACYFARKRGRRYSVDFTSRPDEANIPLSTMEPEVLVDPAPQNGLQTFESADTTAKEPQEPEAKAEAQEEHKAEADKPVVDPSAESAAPAPSPDGSEGNPKADVAEQSPPAPVEPSVEEKTDDEGVVSNKTSVESLKETNENNSNNADFCQKSGLKSSDIFWEVPLDHPM